MGKNSLAVLGAILGVLMAFLLAHAEPVTFAWDPPAEGTPTDYVLIQKDSMRAMTNEYVVAGLTYTVDLASGIYFFTCVARDANQLRSPESNELNVVLFQPPVIRVVIP